MIRRWEFLKTSAAALIYTAANPGHSQSPAQAVSFDNRSVIVASRRKLLACGEVHYPRFSSAMWPPVLERSKAQKFSTRDFPPVIGPFCTNSVVLPALRRLRNKKRPDRAFPRLCSRFT